MKTVFAASCAGMNQSGFRASYKTSSLRSYLVSLILTALFATDVVRAYTGKTRYFHFNLDYQNFTRLCKTKPMLVINGQFPGPTLWAREGDRVIVKLTNHVKDRNITIHWHGVRQIRTGWFDGPAYITQCPIQPGQSYTYNFTITGQRGTLFWHAHNSWIRATVYGAIVILPKPGVPYPFKRPMNEVPIIFGEWWKSDVEAVIKQAIQTGGAPNISDAYTINGQPGPLYNCSADDAFVLPVSPNKTYLLRIINAALNNELFFSIANHKMTVVEIDAVYTKHLETDTILIAPGQSTNVIITADQPEGRYYMAARPYISANNQVDNTTTTAILEYRGSSPTQQPVFPRLPPFNDSNFANNFSKSLRSLGSSKYPSKVPQTIDRKLFFTIGLAVKPCFPGQFCQGGIRLAAAVNNVSFVLPRIALLQSYIFNIPGVFTGDFPDNPARTFNYTGPQLRNLNTHTGTRLSRIAFNSTVQLILQDTALVGIENHPIHLHGYNFFIVGQGIGNYDQRFDDKNF
eukprot:c29376_g1_i1 orf=44-1591(+)